MSSRASSSPVIGSPDAPRGASPLLSSSSRAAKKCFDRRIAGSSVSPTHRLSPASSASSPRLPSRAGSPRKGATRSPTFADRRSLSEHPDESSNTMQMPSLYGDFPTAIGFSQATAAAARRCSQRRRSHSLNCGGIQAQGGSSMIFGGQRIANGSLQRVSRARSFSRGSALSRSDSRSLSPVSTPFTSTNLLRRNSDGSTNLPVNMHSAVGFHRRSPQSTFAEPKSARKSAYSWHAHSASDFASGTDAVTASIDSSPGCNESSDEGSNESSDEVSNESSDDDCDDDIDTDHRSSSGDEGDSEGATTSSRDDFPAGEYEGETVLAGQRVYSEGIFAEEDDDEGDEDSDVFTESEGGDASEGGGGEEDDEDVVPPLQRNPSVLSAPSPIPQSPAQVKAGATSMVMVTDTGTNMSMSRVELHPLTTTRSTSTISNTSGTGSDSSTSPAGSKPSTSIHRHPLPHLHPHLRAHSAVQLGRHESWVASVSPDMGDVLAEALLGVTGDGTAGVPGASGGSGSSSEQRGCGGGVTSAAPAPKQFKQRRATAPSMGSHGSVGSRGSSSGGRSVSHGSSLRAAIVKRFLGQGGRKKKEQHRQKRQSFWFQTSPSAARREALDRASFRRRLQKSHPGAREPGTESEYHAARFYSDDLGHSVYDVEQWTDYLQLKGERIR